MEAVLFTIYLRGGILRLHESCTDPSLEPDPFGSIISRWFSYEGHVTRELAAAIARESEQCAQFPILISGQPLAEFIERLQL